MRPLWAFIFKLWNLLDVILVVLIVYQALLYLDHLDSVNPALEEMRQVKDVYHESYSVARQEALEDLILGALVFASWIKVPATRANSASYPLWDGK